MKRTYNLDKAATLKACSTICAEYQGALTVRQLYYQLVGRGLETNDQLVYKRLVRILTDARDMGDFAPWLIEDRGREVERGDFVEDWSRDGVQYASQRLLKDLERLPYDYTRRARWLGQDAFVSVWVEKAALLGVFEGPCRSLGVSYFACRGYPSVSALWDWLRRWTAAAYFGGCKDAVILYFGDHDPDGLMIPRTALDKIERLRSTYNAYTWGYNPQWDLYCCPYDELGEVRLERVALTRAQIEEFNPPPFPAKVSSSRFAGYVEETGLTDAWELDALEPATLDRLIRTRVMDYFDPGKHAIVQDGAKRFRSELLAYLKSQGYSLDGERPLHQEGVDVGGR